MLSDKAATFLLHTLDLIVLGTKIAPEVITAYVDSRTKLDAMIAEGRDPTEEEFFALEADVRSLRQRLHDHVI